MSKLARVTQKLFGSSSGASQVGKFGSYAAGSAAYSTDPTVIQSLGNWLTGWFGAVVGGNSPAIEDMNAVCLVYAYQLAYIMQSGICEYDSGTTYFIGSLCTSVAGGVMYVSLTDNNLGNALTSAVNWRVVSSSGVRTLTANTSLAATDSLVRSDSTSGNLTHTLPAIANSNGQKIVIKDVGTGGFNTTVQANGAELIDGVTIFATPLSQYDSITLFNNSISWDIL